MNDPDSRTRPQRVVGGTSGIAAAVISLLIILALLWVLFFPRTRWFEPAPHDDPAAVPVPQ